MSGIGQRKLSVRPAGDGTWQWTLRCGCLKVEALSGVWDDDEAILADLLARHRLYAPRCQHIGPLTSPAFARLEAGGGALP